MWCNNLLGEKRQGKNTHFYNFFFERKNLFSIQSDEIEELNIPFLWKSVLVEMYLSNYKPICYFLEFNSYSKTSFKIKVVTATNVVERLLYLYNFIMIKNVDVVESLEYIKFHDIRPEFFQYNMYLYVLERKKFVKETGLQEKSKQVAIELQEELKKNKESEKKEAKLKSNEDMNLKDENVLVMKEERNRILVEDFKFVKEKEKIKNDV